MRVRFVTAPSLTNLGRRSADGEEPGRPSCRRRSADCTSENPHDPRRLGSCLWSAPRNMGGWTIKQLHKKGSSCTIRVASWGCNTQTEGSRMNCTGLNTSFSLTVVPPHPRWPWVHREGTLDIQDSDRVARRRQKDVVLADILLPQRPKSGEVLATFHSDEPEPAFRRNRWSVPFRPSSSDHKGTSAIHEGPSAQGL